MRFDVAAILEISAHIEGHLFEAAMKCPACEGDTRVLDSREHGPLVDRWRICRKCALEFPTEEKPKQALPLVECRNPEQFVDTRAEVRKV